MLKLDNVSKYYYSSSSVTCALNKVNLELKIGEFVAITGESGSGKTTLLNVLSGLDFYEDGEFYYNGKQTSYFDDEDWEKYRKNEIAFIFQHYNLIDSYTVLENVMVSYLIDGYSEKEAIIKSKEMLEKVGLDCDIHKKAAKLSGGQKQRLAIARALSKNTKIIVADEPTGNLDNENGIAILKLLKEVAKDKLVIVVTHNQGQIEPFITRRIRLHDGKIVQDEVVSNSKLIVNNSESNNIVKKKEKKKNELFFSWMNIKSQPKKMFLLLFLFFVSTLSTFVFLLNFKANLDENKTMQVNFDVFVNTDDTRLVVKKADSSIITKDILNEANVKYVESVEEYDYITDINYYRPSDYKMVYGGGYTDQDPPGFVDTSSIVLKDSNNFMRSAKSLDESMLAVGRLPENPFEMVVNSKDLSILGTTESVIFNNSQKWSITSKYTYDLTIVGVIDSAEEQAYFSEEICKILELSQVDLFIKVPFRENYGSREQTLTYSRIVVDPNIGDYDISFPSSQFETVKNSVISNTRNFYIGDIKEWNGYRLNMSNPHSVCSETIGVSLEIFEKIYSIYQEETQFVVFVEDYAYVDEVQDELLKKEFVSISCLKASTIGYDIPKVVIRYVNLFVSIIAMFVMNLMTILLGFAILKVKKNDYVIFKMIGLSNKSVSKINFYEIFIYTLVANILTIITVYIVKDVNTIELISEMYKFFKITDIITVFIVSLVTAVLLSFTFQSFLTKKLKITVLKED